MEQQSVSNPSPPPIVDPPPGARPRLSDKLRAGRRRLLVAVAAAALVCVGLFAVVLPNLGSARLNANESAAIATLKNISSGQSQMQASGFIDVNSNGQGEYGFLAELAATVPLRGTQAVCDPAILPPRLGKMHNGRAQSGGYWYQVFLPGREGGWTTELPGGGAGSEVNPERAEVLWICYAWPVERGVTGNRSFFIDQSGDVLASHGSPAAHDDAMGPIGGLSGYRFDEGLARVAANTLDARGTIWVVV